MLRDPALIPLSHQHQHALALCVRIERAAIATAEEAAQWRNEVALLFEQEIRFHFEAEERVLFPAAERFDELRQLVDELKRDHVALRAACAAAAEGRLDAAELREFAARLAAHVRREERELFEGMQKLLPHEELTKLGAAVERDFGDSGMPGASCEIRS